MSQQGQIRVGISGWRFDGWRGGFYPEDLAQKIIYLYSHKELCALYGSNGYQQLHSFYTLQRMTDEMDSVYNAINKDIPVSLEEQVP